MKSCYISFLEHKVKNKNPSEMFKIAENVNTKTKNTNI